MIAAIVTIAAVIAAYYAGVFLVTFVLTRWGSWVMTSVFTGPARMFVDFTIGINYHHSLNYEESDAPLIAATWPLMVLITILGIPGIMLLLILHWGSWLFDRVYDAARKRR